MNRSSLLLAATALALALPASAAPAKYKVNILNATVKDAAISGAQLILQKNGEQSVTVQTDASGNASVDAPFADDASVTLIAKKDGFSTLVARCPCGGLSYAMSPVMNQLDGLRVVLNWGRTPQDLDSHLVYPGSHVWFQNRDGKDAKLDVDDTDGFGPETITVEKKHAGEKYLYAVHDFTDYAAKGSTALSNVSQVKVFVYVGSSLIRTFTPPKSKAGNLWVVFGIGENGEFYDINKFTDTASYDLVQTTMNQIIQGNFQSVPEVSVDQKALAVQLNKDGEAAYHAKRLDDSIALYQQAIDNDPEFGQAYSNLGLAFQKAGRTAEALWANRKAIALASGPTKETVQASSYYNIAKVYEDQGAFADALTNYQSALSHKQNDAYTKGIARMQAKLGQK